MDQIRVNNNTGNRLIYSMLVCLFFVFAISVNAQSEKKLIRQGNRDYNKNNFSESEISYRRAIDKNKQSPNAVFNTGDALYKQNKFEDAGKQFIESANMNEDKNKRSAAYFNLGNSLLNANKLKESIDAYKGSLKLMPDNIEAKYNLAYAQDMLRKQEEQQRQQQDNKDNKENNKDQKKDDQNMDQNNKDQQNDQNKNEQKDQKNQPQEQNISQEDAERLLNAIANDEKNVQEKVKLAKAAKAQVKTVKNW